MAVSKEEKNRRIKLGLLGLGIVIVSYAVAKITNDVSGDWFKFSILCISLIAIIDGCVTFTDVLGKKF